jgi:hypothetical protein
MSVLRNIGLVVGLLLVVFCSALVLVSVTENPTFSETGELFATIFLAAVAVGGVFLVRWSSPGFFARLLHNFASAPRRFVRWLLLPDTHRTPWGMAVWTWVIGFVLLMLPTGDARFFITFYLFVIYMLFAMIALVALPGWWRRALLTLLLGPVVMTGLVLIAEVFQKDVIGQGGLAFLAPLMWSWAAIPVTGLLRVLFARPSPPPTSQASPPA